jgi:hypothetical protein
LAHFIVGGEVFDGEGLGEAEELEEGGAQGLVIHASTLAAEA